MATIDDGGRVRRPRGFWMLRVLVVISIPIVLAMSWVAIKVLWSRTHQDISLPAAPQTLPMSGPVERTGPGGSKVLVSTVTVDQGGKPRTALVSRPTDVGPTERLPVVFFLHGLGGTSEIMFDEAANGFTPAARRVIAVFPQGVWRSWNAGQCCRPSTTLGIDDVAFLHALVTDMKRRPQVDPTKVFMTGFSNGGMMVYRYLCDHADEVAGAMSVAGINISGCEPNAPVPFLQMSGTKDVVVPYYGDNSALGRLFGPWSIPTAQGSIEAVSDAMGCDPRSTAGPSSTFKQFVVTSREWTSCPSGGRIRFVTYGEQGHWWPSGPPWAAVDDGFRFFGLS